MNLMHVSNEDIIRAVKSQEFGVCVVGLGRIGLPTAAVFADSGLNVIGVDTNEETVREVNSGYSRFIDEPGLAELVRRVTLKGNLVATVDFSCSIPKSNLIVLCVPTPVSEMKVPDLSCIVQASTDVAKFMKKGALIIIESTVSPGTVEDTVIPLIERESGLKVTKDFGVASCPERANPGESLSKMHSVPRVIGGIDSRSTEIASLIYEHALNVEVVKVSSPKTANAAKLTENIFRDVNIALMSEFAILYEKLGIDIFEVLEACSTKWNFVPHYPGAGVGGPCLPSNAYYVIAEGVKVGYVPSLPKMAREINDKMPDHVVSLVTKALSRIEKIASGSKIAILGVSYKPNIHDLQMTPFKTVFFNLRQMGAKVAIYDPVFKGEMVFGVKVEQNAEDALKAADCIIIGSSNEEFRKMNLNKIVELCNQPAALVDTQHIVSPSEARQCGFLYSGVGRC
jgi:nucleotide sugar dehydrogenase